MIVTQRENQAAPSPAYTPVRRGLLQRACACGNHTVAGGECEACKKKREAGLQRAAISPAAMDEVPPIVHEVLGSPGQPLDAGMRAFMEPRFGHDFSGVPAAAAARFPASPRLAISDPDDQREHEANQVAAHVLSAPPPVESAGQPLAAGGGRAGPTRRLDPDAQALPSVSRSGGGTPLPQHVRAFMEPRFGADFSQVRVHTDAEARQMSRGLHAMAFTHQHDIYFGEGRAPGNDSLTAHELTHVLQQTSAQTTGGSTIQRAVEVRPPGRGEASAFDRRQELIDRLNTLSAAIQYRLDGRRIVYDLIDEAALTEFDRQMRAFIDRGEVVPMRLITRAGLVGGSAVLIDFFDAGYVDLDDLLASSDLSLQMNLVHLLTERFRVRNYERRIGTAFSDAEFNRAHAAGLQAETELLRSVVGDPTLRFNYEETRPNGTSVFAFRSAEGYRIFHVFRRGGQLQRGGELFAQTRDGRRLTIEQLIAERAAAPVAP